MISRFRRFARDEAGAATMEMAVMTPFLLALIIGMTMIWDGFRAMNSHLKATYTIADALAREPLPITQDTIDTLDLLHGAMSNVSGGTNFRISVIQGKAVAGQDNGEPELKWSQSSDPVALLPVANLNEINDHIPLMTIGDELLVIETFGNWIPMWEAGAPPLVTFSEVVTIRPRFTGDYCWQACT